MTSQADLQDLLYHTLSEPIGVLLRTSDPRRLRQQLYSARSACQDSRLNVLQFRLSPWAEGDLVICKTGPVPLPALGRPAQLSPEDLE